MDAAVLVDRLPEVTRKPLLGPAGLSLQCWHGESSKVLAGLAFCEMLSKHSESALRGFKGRRGVQQQFATQTLRVHLLGIDHGKNHKSFCLESRQSNTFKSLMWFPWPLGIAPGVTRFSSTALIVSSHSCALDFVSRSLLRELPFTPRAFSLNWGRPRDSDDTPPLIERVWTHRPCKTCEKSHPVGWKKSGDSVELWVLKFQESKKTTTRRGLRIWST